MADSSVPITAGSGTNIDTRTESINGDHRQVVVLGDPVTGANVAQVSAAGALYVQGYQGAINTLNVTTSSSTTGAIEAANYNIAMVSIHGTHAGINLTWEISDDGGTTWYAVQAQRDDTGAVSTTSGVVTSNASWSWTIPVGAATHIRVRSTAYTSGTGVVGVSLQSMPYEPIPSVFIQGAVDTELPAAAALADATTNPTVPTAGASNMVFNGTTWDRMKEPTADAAAATGLAAAGNMVWNGSNWDRMKEPTADAAAATGLAAAGNMLWNGTNWDRAKGQLAADAGTNVGIQTVQPVQFNGTSHDRWRGGTYYQNIDTLSARTASGNGTTATNYNGATGLILWVRVTAVSGTTPTLTVRLQWSPDDGTTWIDWDTTNLQTTSITATTTAILKVGMSGVTTAANAAKADLIPRKIRCAWTIGGTTPSFTFANWFQFLGGS